MGCNVSISAMIMVFKEVRNGASVFPGNKNQTSVSNIKEDIITLVMTLLWQPFQVLHDNDVE